MSIPNIKALTNLNLTELSRLIATDKDALDVLVCLNFFELNSVCWRCESKTCIIYETRKTKVYCKYLCKFCTIRTSVFNNTIFHKTKLSPRQILILLHCFSFSRPATCVAEETRLKAKAVSKYYLLFKQVIQIHLCRTSTQKIGGPGLTVEIDETHLFNRT